MVSITEDIKTITDLKKKTHSIFEQIHKTGRPVFITVHGKPDAVILDPEVFEKKMKALSLGKLLAEAEQEVKNGKTRPASEFLKDLKENAKEV
ncbi:MAG: type II toxin-antitoxin system Phd/YefM family antitoxin [Elusimicrobiota bacterium]